MVVVRPVIFLLSTGIFREAGRNECVFDVSRRERKEMLENVG